MSPFKCWTTNPERSKVQFGATLKDINDRLDCLNSIPPVVRMCSDYFFLEDSVIVEGIFRKSGNEQRIKLLKQKIDNGELSLNNFIKEKEDGFVVGCLLKMFFREMPEPLITYEFYDEIFNIMKLPEEQRPSAIKSKIKKMPKENRELFKYLIEFLVRIKGQEQCNRMTAKNLSIVFGPNIARCRNETKLDPQTQISHSNKVNEFLEYVIENNTKIYDFDMRRWKTMKGPPNFSGHNNTSNFAAISKQKILSFFESYFASTPPAQFP